MKNASNYCLMCKCGSVNFAIRQDGHIECNRCGKLSDKRWKAQDEVVEANRQMVSKYGKNLTRDDLPLEEWIQHALEEALVTANYLQAAKR